MQSNSDYQFSEENLMEKLQQFNWEDADAVLQQLPLHPLYQIVSSPQYDLYYQRLRFVLQKEEISERSFHLTGLILSIRTSSYYALMLRKQCFFSQNITESNQQSQEIAFINDLLSSASKEYHLWTYKKEILQKYKPNIFETELKFVNQLLDKDSKNYHVWDYRFWLVELYGKINEEFQWTETELFRKQNNQTLNSMINEIKLEQGINVKIQIKHWQNCYSFWSYRFNLIQKLKKSSEQIHEKQEVELFKLISWLKQKQNQENECGWLYLSGLINEFKLLTQENVRQALDFSQDIYQNNSNNRFAGNCVLLISMHFLKKCPQSQFYKSLKVKTIKSLQSIDNVRQLYYSYLLSK